MEPIITFEQRAAFPHSDGPGGSILAQAQLHEEEWNTSNNEHDEVGDEKHTCEDEKYTSVRKGGGAGGDVCSKDLVCAACRKPVEAG